MSSLPSGTVTFVFTDIEESTALLQRLGDGYAGVLAEHRRIVRDAFGGNGVEIDTQGDAFFYAFPRAPWGTASEFVAEAIRHNVLIIPGNVFSRRDTHFRISYAVDDATLARGLDVLRALARRA